MDKILCCNFQYRKTKHSSVPTYVQVFYESLGDAKINAECFVIKKYKQNYRICALQEKNILVIKNALHKKTTHPTKSDRRQG